MKKPPIFLFAAICILPSCLIGCSGEKQPWPVGRKEGVASEAPSNPIAVEVFEVKTPAEPDDQLIPAVISVEGTAMILAQRDGILIELRGQEGSRVAKGELLARINDDDQRAQLRQAELEANRLGIEEQQYQAMVKVNQTELEQEKQLDEDGLTSKRQVNRAQYKLDVTIKELERSRLATQAARAKIDAIKIEIEKSSIRAPIGGIVTHRFVRLGAGVVKNDKLFEVSQVDQLQVKFQLPQTVGAGRLKPGGLVRLSLPESDGVTAQARIRRIDPVADAASNTIGYLADVVGSPGGLIPGAAVNVRVPGVGGAAKYTIPLTAFHSPAELRRGSAGALFVVEDDRSAARAVWINSIEGDQVEIGSGLIAGDRVIIKPAAELKAGSPVKITGTR